MFTRFCLVRHGETDWNAEKRVQGHIDIELNAVGEAQARALRPGLGNERFAAVYSSDLRRAWRTAELATSGLDLPAVVSAPTFRERHHGICQGLTAQELQARHPEAYRHHAIRNLDYGYGDGEALGAFAARVLAAFNLVATRHREGSVLVFTHGGVLDVMYRAATGRALEAPRDFLLPNAALNWLECRDGRWTMLSWADTTHLGRTLDEVAE